MAWDDQRVVGYVEHDQFEKVPGLVGTGDEVAIWVAVQFLPGDEVVEGVDDVFVVDAVPAGRRVDLHTK